MASLPKERPRSGSPIIKHRKISQSSPSFSSSLYSSLIEPSTNLFPSKNELPRLLSVIAISTTFAVACNFVVNYLNPQIKPFCDSNADFEHSVQDLCEPCPSNGMCYEGKLDCARGFREIGKSCIEDGDIGETAKRLSELAESRVCEAYAAYLCDGTGSVWIQEEKVWNYSDEFRLMEKYGLDNSIYMYAKQRAMETVGYSLETKENSQGVKELKCPELLAEHYKPFACYIRQLIVQNALVIVPACALLVGGTLMLLRIHGRHYLSIRTEQLYNQVCDILEEKAFMSKSVNGDGEPWVVASWLRDHLLSPRERKDPLLWKKVEELIQEDSRLDRYPRMVKGEAKVVWEWQVEGSLSLSGKRKKGEDSNKASKRTNFSSNQQCLPLKVGE